MLTRETEIKVNQIKRLEGDGALKAFVDVAFGDLLQIRGIRVVSGKKGVFVAMPETRGKDGKWYPIVSIFSDELKEAIEQIVLEEYREGADGAES